MEANQLSFSKDLNSQCPKNKLKFKLGTSSRSNSSIFKEAKSFLCLSITTYLGGFPGIGMNGSITYRKLMSNRCLFNVIHGVS